MTVDAELYKKSSPVMSQTSITNKAMGWRQGEEGRSLAHKTRYCLGLDLKTSEGVWDIHSSAEGQTVSQEWHLRKISNSEASFNCHGI